MANEIYKVTWWGLPIKDGWGGIYYEYAYDTGFPLVSYYSDRVKNDGGIVESLDCVSEALSSLSIYNWDYYFRVEKDGGVVESLECVFYEYADTFDDRLIFSVKTDNAGTSASNQFTIPTTGTGYSYDIETSDGQTITGLTSGTTITFSSAGTYDVFITGAFPQFFFNNSGDRLKLIELKNFGTYGQGSTSQSRAFQGCSNLVISATDTGYFGNANTFVRTWNNCSSLTSFPLIDISGANTLPSTWEGCSSLTSFPQLNTSNVTYFGNTWVGCSSLTSFPLLDTSNGTNFALAWFNCNSLVTFPANAFDTNIASNYTNAFTATNLSTQSIDDILVSLDVSGVSNGTFTQTGGSTPSTIGLNAKTNLINKGWTVTTT